MGAGITKRYFIEKFNENFDESQEDEEEETYTPFEEIVVIK